MTIVRYLFSTAFAVLVGVAFAAPALALTVSPAKIEVTGDPGQTITGEIEVYSEQEGTRTFYSSFENFEPKGDSGAPHFIGADDGLATWITTQPEVAINFDQRLVVPFSITIPAEAAPGGYFAAIFFGDQPPTQEGGQVSVGGKIGVLVLLRVSGEVTEGGGIVDFGTVNQQKLFVTLPVNFEYRIDNSGGDRVVPRGEIAIKNTFRMTSHALQANPNEGSVLPGSARKFEVMWGEEPATEESYANPSFFDMVAKEWQDFHFGWYTAELNLRWGEDEAYKTASYDFFVVPWHLLTVIGAGLIVLGFILILGVKRYNRWIIAAAARQQQSLEKPTKLEKSAKVEKEEGVDKTEKSEKTEKSVKSRKPRSKKKKTE